MDLKISSRRSMKQKILSCLCLLAIIFSITEAIAENNSNTNSPSDYFIACQRFDQSYKQFNSQSQAPGAPIAINSVRTVNKGAGAPCRSYKCLIHSDTLDLEKMRDFQCDTNVDCAPDISKMICSNHSISSVDSPKYCSCPQGYAYSTTECQCKPAELCWSSQDPCHKGMKCQDEKCSCRNIENLLYEIHGGFCIEPRTTHFGIDHLTSAKDSEKSQQSGPEVVIVSILAAIVILGFIGIGLYILSVRRKDIDFCARGDYVCDNDTLTPGNRANQPHVAAWDAPGMDFLSEEQTLKYINRSNSIEVATKSPSIATTAELVDEAPSPSGSLPECEQSHNRQSRIHQIQVETNFVNPTFNGASSSSRHSSESKDSVIENLQDDTSSVTKSSNIL